MASLRDGLTSGQDHMRMQKSRTNCVLVCVSVVLIAMFVQHALCASFDCTRSVTQREKLVCGDPELLKADSDLSQEYASALARVSAENVSALRSDQRNWLRFADVACPIPKDDGEDGPKDARFCLRNLYAHRYYGLKESGVRYGSLRFVDRQTFWAVPVRPLCGDDANTNQKGGIEQLTVSYPQIDDPLNAQTLQWNHIAKQTAIKLQDEPKMLVAGVSYQIITAGDHIISVLWRRGWCNGTRQGGGESRGQTILLEPRLHMLVGTDLFRANQDWQRTLRERAVAAAKQTDQGSFPDFPLDLFRSIAVEPSHWLLRADGLAILTDPEVFGRCGTCEVLLPWSDLRGILAHGPPLF